MRARSCRSLRIGSVTANGATTTSSLIAGKVCFQEAAKPTSTADMRRFADRQLRGRLQTVRFQGNLAGSGRSALDIRT
jgi:hypothetical protein